MGVTAAEPRVDMGPTYRRIWQFMGEFRRGIAAAVGFAQAAYGALAVYLWWRLGRDWVVGWSARHAAVNR